MARLLTLAIMGAVLALALVPGAAEARINIRIGIGDQQTRMFDNPHFQRAKFKRVRYFIPWNVMDNGGQLAAADQYVRRARQSRIRVFLHVSSHDLGIRSASLPSVSAYHTKVRRMVRHFRRLGVREFGTWNEANHASQPTYRSPKRAAQYFKVMYRLVKGRCRSCTVVALDVLDQRGVERYMRRWYRSLSGTWRRRARTVGIHNYGDVNRKRTRYTRNIIRTARRYNRRSRIWFTETGGIVKFGKSFPCSTTRAKNRLAQMFRLAKRYRRQGVQRVYIYNWSGAGCNARFDAGLTTPSGKPRSAYHYVRRALKTYRR